MANPWFRMYSEFSDDPKVQMMSEAMQRRLTMLMCSKCKDETLHETERAFHWRISETELAETKSLFIAKGFIDDDWNLLNWNKRQFISDSSTNRVRRHRQGKKQDETLHETDGTKEKQPTPVTVTAPPAAQEELPVDTEARAVAEEQRERDHAINFGIDRLFSYYCRKVGRDPTRYTLTTARRKKARLRIEEREKLSGSLEDAIGQAKKCIENLAASEHHRKGGYIDWTEQIFRSKEEFEKRLNWQRPEGGSNAGRTFTGPRSKSGQVLDDLRRSLEEDGFPVGFGEAGNQTPSESWQGDDGYLRCGPAGDGRDERTLSLGITFLPAAG